MYFIDLSMRNIEQGYRDSIALIADVIGAHGLTDLLAEADAILPDDPYCDSLSLIIEDAENIAANYGFIAFAHEGYYYVMTSAEFEEWDFEHAYNVTMEETVNE